MVTQHKIAVFRHLIGELDVAFPQGKLVHVWLVQRLTVHGDNAVLIQRDHVARQADDTLEQKLVLPVKPHRSPVFMSPVLTSRMMSLSCRVGFMLSPET